MRIPCDDKRCPLVLIIVSGLFFFLCLISTNYTYAAPVGGIDDLKKQIETKNDEIKKLEEEAYLYRREVALRQQKGKTLQGELNRIDQTVKRLKNEIAVTERKIQKAALEIQRTGLDIHGKETKIKKLKRGVAGILQVLSERDQESPLTILTKHESLVDFFQELDHLMLAKTAILESVNELRILKEELEEKKAEEQNKKRELEVLEDSLGDRKKLHEEIRGERGELLRATKNQERRYQEMLQETERKQEAILKDIEALEEELRKLIDVSSLPVGRKGVLVWPAQGILAQGYGETPFTKSARGRHFYRFHNGIDIAAEMGTPVAAADEGIIIAVGNTDTYCPRGAYGKYVVIQHPRNLATMYAHLSFFKVAKNKKVNRGEVIGYAGSSGLSTGSHLHFTVYDARTVEIKLGKIGTCGPLPFGGSIDPMKYL